MNIDPVIVWFVIGLVLALLEFALPGVILIFFGMGAWIAAITTYIGLTPGIGSQLIAFSISCSDGAELIVIPPLERFTKFVSTCCGSLI